MSPFLVKVLRYIFIAAVVFIFPKYTFSAGPGVPKDLAQQRKASITNIKYDLFFHIPASRKERIMGEEVISLHLNNINEDLILDFKDSKAEIRNIIANGKASIINHKDEHIVISKTFLKKGYNTVRINFAAGDLSLNRNDDFLYTLLVPERARTFFPCFDQPDLKAVFKLKLDIPADWEAVSNGKIAATTHSPGRRQLTFSSSDPISTYLFSIVAGKFKKETRTVGNREMNFFYRETDTEKIKESIDTIFQLHRVAIEFMEKYSGIKYPFQKLDFIAIQDFPYGGMEHVGAIDYNASTLFLDKKALPGQRLERVQVIAHEISHMWFGNLVTMKWFDDVWMKEVFANFMADKIVKQIMPDSLEQMRFLLSHHPAAYYVDRTEGSNPIRQSLNNLDQAGTLYGAIIYHKAPIVMGQLEALVGEPLLKKALRKYLKQFSFGNADWPELIRIIDELSPEDITAWNEQWVNKSGRPLLSYSIENENKRIKRFSIYQQGESGSPGNWKQRIMISLVYADSIHTIPVVINGPQSVFKDAIGLPAPLFVLFNSDGTGYGSFPVDSDMPHHMPGLKDPLLRACGYINIYEKVLDGTTVNPEQMLMLYAGQLATESEPLILSRMIRDMRNIFWQFLNVTDRKRIAEIIEPKIWNAIAAARDPAKRKTLFQLLSYTAITPGSIDRIYSIWDSTYLDLQIPLNEDDYTATACELAVRKPTEADSIFAKQLRRINNEERKQRFIFIKPALAADATVRDSFFQSLLKKENRHKKNWVLAGLQYLHHPLRDNWGIQYVKPSLEILEEVQMAGDIFFPTDWLRSTFNFYNHKEAAQIVKDFLSDHPGYNKGLRLKILQETDDLFRVQKFPGINKN